MRKKRSDFDAVGFERMTDAELSKKLGSYQRTESISISLGVLLVIAGCISMFIQHDPILVCALAFPGVALFLLVAKPAQTKKKALMQQQLGSFFRTELTKAFGPEPEPATLPIDRAYLKAAKLSAVPFTECTLTDFHEGEHKGRRFSAANVELRRTVEEKSGPDNDNWMTRTETLFRGIVIRCKDICDPALDIACLLYTSQVRARIRATPLGGISRPDHVVLRVFVYSPNLSEISFCRISQAEHMVSSVMAFSASAQLIAVLDLLVRCDQHDAALAVCAEDKDLRHEYPAS